MSKTSRHRKKENHLSSYKGLIFRGNSNLHRHLLKTTRILGSALFFLLFSVIVVNLFFAKSASAAEQSAKAVATDCLKIKGAYFYAIINAQYIRLSYKQANNNQSRLKLVFPINIVERTRNPLFLLSLVSEFNIEYILL